MTPAHFLPRLSRFSRILDLSCDSDSDEVEESLGVSEHSRWRLPPLRCCALRSILSVPSFRFLAIFASGCHHSPGNMLAEDDTQDVPLPSCGLFHLFRLLRSLGVSVETFLSRSTSASVSWISIILSGGSRTGSPSRQTKSKGRFFAVCTAQVSHSSRLRSARSSATPPASSPPSGSSV